MGPFPPSKKYEYILVAVDYVSKWVEAMTCRNADSMHSKKMFEDIPDDWVCPLCGVGKEDFSPVEE